MSEAKFVTHIWGNPPDELYALDSDGNICHGETTLTGCGEYSVNWVEMGDVPNKFKTMFEAVIEANIKWCEENQKLKAELSESVNFGKNLQLERDELKAEVERLRYEAGCNKEPKYSIEFSDDGLRVIKDGKIALATPILSVGNKFTSTQAQSLHRLSTSAYEYIDAREKPLVKMILIVHVAKYSPDQIKLRMVNRDGRYVLQKLMDANEANHNGFHLYDSLSWEDVPYVDEGEE